MSVLGIFSAYGGASVAFAGVELRIDAEQGLAAALPALVARLLDRARPDLVAVATGPGSFTGLRAGIAVATGIGLALGVPVVGVTVREALAQALPPLDDRTLWVAIAARRGRVFIDQGDGPAGTATDALPRPQGRIALVGNAANEVAAALAAAGADVMLPLGRVPLGRHVAAVGVARQAGALAPLAARPLYVDAPEAKLPAAGLRAAPA